MNKIKLQPGDVIASIYPGFLSTLVRVLQLPLLWEKLKNILAHIETYIGNNTTYGASTAGVTYYQLSALKKAKRVIVIRFSQFSNPKMQRKLIVAVRKRIAKHEKYGYVNYIIWWIKFLPFVLLPSLGFLYATTGSIIILFYGMLFILALIFPVSWWFRKSLGKTQVCSEAKVRLFQEDLGIDQGCTNPESWTPNHEWKYGIKARDAEIIADFNPLKVGFILEEYNG